MCPETRLARTLTRFLAAGHLLFALAWVLPLHGTVLPDRVSTTIHIASYGPVWAVGFGVVGLLLAVARQLRGTGRWGHAIGAVVTLTYGAASGTSAAFSEPLGSFLPALAFGLLAAMHIVLQRYYDRRRA